MSKAKPCIVYKETLDPSTMTLVKVETIVGGNFRSKKIPIFTGSTGVEGLFFVIDRFVKAATWLQFTPADLWDQFEEVLDTVAEKKWINLTQGIWGQVPLYRWQEQCPGGRFLSPSADGAFTLFAGSRWGDSHGFLLFLRD